MPQDERANAHSETGAQLTRAGSMADALRLAGAFSAELVRDGAVIWRDEFHNLVTTAGKNLALDTFLAGSAYTVTGPYMGLVSSVSYSAVAAGDTMSSHAGWTEAGIANAPTYTTRKTCAWSSASAGSKALSSALGFTFTGAGTVKGAFLVFGAGASATVDNTSGTLLSAGLFSGGDRAVLTGDQLNVSYSLAL